MTLILAQSLALLSALLGIGGTLVLLFANYTFQQIEDAQFNSPKLEETNKRIKAKNKWRYRILNFGLALLCGSFGVQAVTVFLTYSQRVGKTAAYVAQAGDCGKIFSLGGNAFYTFTIGAASSFPAECSITVTNIDSGRGKATIVFGLSVFRLFPRESVTYRNEGSAWVQVPEFQATAANPTLHVNFVSGSDDPSVSDCMATGTGACKTFTQAVLLAKNRYWPHGVIIQADCESQYDQSVSVIDIPYIVNIIGNTGNPSACQFNRTVSSAIFDVQDYAILVISGFQISSSVPTIFFNARQHVIIDIDTMILGPNAGGGTDIQVVNTSSVNLTGQITLNGNGGVLIAAGLNSVVTVNATFMVSAATSAGFTTWFRADSSASITGFPNYNIAGSVTGQQFICSNNATIQLGTPYPPDLSAGLSSSGCQH